MGNNVSEHTDDLLIDKVKKGDTYAFAQLVDKYKDVSLSLIYSIVKDKHLAEDILQNVFIKVFEKMHTFKKNAAFHTWLYRIAVNTSYNELKKKKLQIPLENTNLDAQHTEKVTQKLTAEQQKKYIHLALDRMKTDEVLVLRLFYLSELSLKEVMKVTGFSKSKVKTCLHRGRINLEFELQKLLGTELKDLL